MLLLMLLLLLFAAIVAVGVVVVGIVVVVAAVASVVVAFATVVAVASAVVATVVVVDAVAVHRIAGFQSNQHLHGFSFSGEAESGSLRVPSRPVHGPQRQLRPGGHAGKVDAARGETHRGRELPGQVGRDRQARVVQQGLEAPAAQVLRLHRAHLRQQVLPKLQASGACRHPGEPDWPLDAQSTKRCT